MNAVIIGVTLATAVLGAVISAGESDPWYNDLIKPWLTPPDRVFAIVWPVLFILMAISAILVRQRAGSFEAASGALGLYFTQLAVNLSWSWLFFGFHQTGLAMLALLALWILILCMIRAFGKFSLSAPLLQLPYLIWVTFAGYLNLSILLLNP